MGLITQEIYNARLQALGLQTALLNLPNTISVDVMLNIIGDIGSGALSAALQQMDSTPANVVIPPPIVPKLPVIQPPGTIEIMAGGGTAGIGDWAMVGDLPGGGILPTTEYVRANRGGGFTVFNQSQMAGKSAPPMASGGMVMPQSDEVTLSQQSIRDLADALAFKMSQVQ